MMKKFLMIAVGSVVTVYLLVWIFIPHRIARLHSWVEAMGGYFFG